ncbi:MAG: terminase small subunit [Rhodospirillales bacterium]
MARKNKLTERQRRFVEEYLIDVNVSAAAARAGYSAHTARHNACRLMRNPAVRAAIEAALNARAERTRITQDKVLEALAALAFYDPGEIAGAGIESPADIARLPARLRPAVAGWGWDAKGRFRVHLAGRHPALAALARHLGLFPPRGGYRPGEAPDGKGGGPGGNKGGGAGGGASEPLDETARWLEEVLREEEAGK